MAIDTTKEWLDWNDPLYQSIASSTGQSGGERIRNPYYVKPALTGERVDNPYDDFPDDPNFADERMSAVSEGYYANQDLSGWEGAVGSGQPYVSPYSGISYDTDPKHVGSVNADTFVPDYNPQPGDSGSLFDRFAKGVGTVGPAVAGMLAPGIGNAFWAGGGALAAAGSGTGGALSGIGGWGLGGGGIGAATNAALGAGIGGTVGGTVGGMLGSGGAIGGAPSVGSGFGGAVGGTGAGSLIPGISNPMALAGGVSLASGIFKSVIAKKAAEDQAAAALEASGMTADAAREAARMQLEAMDKAVQAQQMSSQDAIAELRRQFNVSSDLLAPWVTSGRNINEELTRRVMAGPGEFTESPGYQFRLQEGLDAVKAQMGPRYGVVSGPTIKASQQYASDLASQEHGTFLNQYYQSLNPLQTGSEQGRLAAGAVGAGAQGVGGNVANIMTGTASNLGNLYTGGAQAAGQYGLAGAQAGAGGVQQAAAARASGYIDPTEMITGSVGNMANEYMKMQMWKNMGLFDNK